MGRCRESKSGDRNGCKRSKYVDDFHRHSSLGLDQVMFSFINKCCSETVFICCHHGKLLPERARTVEISPMSMVPEALKSPRKLVAVAA